MVETMNLKILAVLTDKNSISIHNFCHEKSISLFVGNPRQDRLKQFISNITVEFIISINYLFLIGTDLISFPLKAAINLHGSLLPKYRGRTPHIWAIINNEKITGITAHLISEECDEGDIILQKEILIDQKDTGAELLVKYQNEYPAMIQELLDLINDNSLTYMKQNSSFATYYDKRSPDDGRINWEWQKERIYNWVRALAYPYPGAFCFYKGQKIVIDRCFFSNLGYDCSQKNGTILFIAKTNQLIVKTQNGAIGISLRIGADDLKYKFKIGNFLK
jgi:methionyl-tRNA formyltransferase